MLKAEGSRLKAEGGGEQTLHPLASSLQPPMSLKSLEPRASSLERPKVSADVGVVIPAAGFGRRFGGATRKSLARVAGRPLVAHALRACVGARSVGWIIVATHQLDVAAMTRVLRAEGIAKGHVIEGGDSRADSVARGVAALPPEARWVLIHDAARPCVRAALIESAIEQARRHGAIACGLPAGVTVKSTDGAGQVRLTLDRDGLWFAQTPQVMRRDWLADALQRVAQWQSRQAPASADLLSQFPDDVALLEWAGYPVRMIPGDPWNIKVTTQDDVLLAEAILQAQSSRLKAQGKSTTKNIRVRALSPARQRARDCLAGAVGPARGLEL